MSVSPQLLLWNMVCMFHRIREASLESLTARPLTMHELGRHSIENFKMIIFSYSESLLIFFCNITAM